MASQTLGSTDLPCLVPIVVVFTALHGDVVRIRLSITVNVSVGVIEVSVGVIDF